MVVYLSYNVAGSNNLAGLKQLLVAHRPDYVFMQEVSVSKEQMEVHLGSSYRCQVNVEELHGGAGHLSGPIQAAYSQVYAWILYQC